MNNSDIWEIINADQDTNNPSKSTQTEQRILKAIDNLLAWMPCLQ